MGEAGRCLLDDEWLDQSLNNGGGGRFCGEARGPIQEAGGARRVVSYATTSHKSNTRRATPSTKQYTAKTLVMLGLLATSAVALLASQLPQSSNVRIDIYIVPR